MKTLLTRLSVACIAGIALSSCTLKPTVVETTPAGVRVVSTIGGSVFTKSQAEDSSITTINGTEIHYKVWGLDEQAVPLSHIRAGATEAVLGPVAKPIGVGFGTVLRR